MLRLIFTALLVLTPVGCAPPSVAPPNTERPKIALIMKSLANDFFAVMADGAERHHVQHAAEYDLTVVGIKNETDLAEQVGLVEQMTARGVRAIVIAPADSKALVPALRRAQQAGVLVVNIDNRLDADLLHRAGLTAPFVGPDNRDGARRVAQVVAEKLKPGDEAAIIEGVTTAFNGRERRAGFEAALQAAGIRIVDVQSGRWEMERAASIAADLLTAHPNLRALLCANDNMALGAATAVQAAGKTDRVLIAGFDHIAAVRPLVTEGRIVATADQHADQLAVYGIQTALELLRGGATPQDRTTDVDVIRK